MNTSCFSSSYAEARERFLEAASSLGADITSHPLSADSRDALAIDVATVGRDGDPTIVTSSGVHGVEGFMGSAVQLALLNRLAENGLDPNVRHVLIHAVNPYGFSTLRRFNEDNVDLNRNFLQSAKDYQGAPDGYAEQDRFLNPKSPPSSLEPFKVKAVWNIWRNGLQKLKQSVAAGQYEFPQGLFFGGRGPSESARLVIENCDTWIGTSERVIHIDFHSGLGAFGTYKLLLSVPADSPDYRWYTKTFGADCVEAYASPGEATAYDASGLFNEWMRNHFSSRDYKDVCAEFGTYPVIRVLGALRAENRSHHHGSEASSSYQSSKRELLECFCPQDESWRERVVDSGLEIIDQSTAALRSSDA